MRLDPEDFLETPNASSGETPKVTLLMEVHLKEVESESQLSSDPSSSSWLSISWDTLLTLCFGLDPLRLLLPPFLVAEVGRGRPSLFKVFQQRSPECTLRQYGHFFLVVDELGLFVLALGA